MAKYTGPKANGLESHNETKEKKRLQKMYKKGKRSKKKKVCTVLGINPLVGIDYSWVSHVHGLHVGVAVLGRLGRKPTVIRIVSREAHSYLQQMIKYEDKVSCSGFNGIEK